MTPKMTKAMFDSAVKDGAEVKERRKVAKPPERPAPPTMPIPVDRGPEIEALKAEISELRETLAAERKAADRRSHELSAIAAALSENKPVRIKPIRDMDRDSPTYLLVDHYDFVPVAYQPRKLDS